MILTGWEIFWQLHHQFFWCMYIYKMSSEAKEFNQIRKITAEKYSENKIHTL